MDLQHQADVAAVDGALVVERVRAVGRPHLHQAGARLDHHLGHAEAASDLDQLAARDDDAPVARQGGQHEEHGGCSVVHDEGGLGSGGPGQERCRAPLSRAAAPCSQVELEVGVRRLLGVGQWRPAQVGVQQHAGGIDDRAQEIESHALGTLAGRRGVIRGDGSPGGVDQQRVGKLDVGQLAGESVDRRWTHA